MKPPSLLAPLLAGALAAAAALPYLLSERGNRLSERGNGLSERGNGEEERPPNVLVLFSDDQGYADLGLAGSRY